MITYKWPKTDTSACTPAAPPAAPAAAAPAAAPPAAPAAAPPAAPAAPAAPPPAAAAAAAAAAAPFAAAAAAAAPAPPPAAAKKRYGKCLSVKSVTSVFRYFNGKRWGPGRYRDRLGETVDGVQVSRYLMNGCELRAYFPTRALKFFKPRKAASSIFLCSRDLSIITRRPH
jgi:hypothetical protein